MSNYYNPHKNPNWLFQPGVQNNFKLSRSKIDLFLQCPRCFYLDNRLGTARPGGFPFTLNSAVDYLLKKEFDLHRAKDKQHPLIEKYGIDATPVAHEQLDEWRENFKGIRYFHEPTGLTITGAIDDLWQNSKAEYIVVDYKATSKDKDITELDEDWQDSYKRQMEIYQWLLRQNGYKVSDTGYFVYCNGITDRKAFDAKLEFDITLVSYIGDDSWVEKTIINAHKCLLADKIPAPNPDCDFCKYREAVGEAEK
ncbi:PD-(D/E)XK nuclease family protein [Patescibacteria group bacterium]|nr:PD-(D/E)XK nuclease family protein [Patescibacteria group bacterium]MBU4512104.1 PD-(D/E)XK nuclease family protein [Patescibacteria group bacterium]MCG2693119.1 PD-(D/E)XK nuclease family protein [Candidatus Parcubacteria bacterium]